MKTQSCETQLHQVEIHFISINLQTCARRDMYMVKVSGEDEDRTTLYIVDFLASTEATQMMHTDGSVTLLVDTAGTARKIVLGKETLTVIHI